MADDVKRVQPLYGPYAGQQLDMPAADADAAIADGWAIDPFAPPAETKELSAEERDQVVEKADKAARKLRGEEQPAQDAGKKPTTATPTAAEAKETKSLEAEKPAGAYQTRSTIPPKTK